MNKAQLIEAVASRGDLSRDEATRAIDAIVEVITESLRQGDPVSLVGFGQFVVRARAARKGKNPRTKETIDLPSSRIPAFKAGKMLKDAVQ